MKKSTLALVMVAIAITVFARYYEPPEPERPPPAPKKPEPIDLAYAEVRDSGTERLIPFQERGTYRILRGLEEEELTDEQRRRLVTALTHISGGLRALERIVYNRIPGKEVAVEILIRGGDLDLRDVKGLVEDGEIACVKAAGLLGVHALMECLDDEIHVKNAILIVDALDTVPGPLRLRADRRREGFVAPTVNDETIAAAIAAGDHERVFLMMLSVGFFNGRGACIRAIVGADTEAAHALLREEAYYNEDLRDDIVDDAFDCDHAVAWRFATSTVELMADLVYAKMKLPIPAESAAALARALNDGAAPADPLLFLASHKAHVGLAMQHWETHADAAAVVPILLRGMSLKKGKIFRAHDLWTGYKLFDLLDWPPSTVLEKEWPRIGSAAVPALLDAVRNSRDPRYAAAALVVIGDRSAIKGLQAIANSSDAGELTRKVAKQTAQELRSGFR